MTDNEIRRLWLQMGNYWRQFAVPDDETLRAVMLEDWRPFLVDVAADNARAAVMAMATEKWPPPPGEVRLRALVAEGVADAAPDTDVAWLEVCRQIRAVGHAGLPEWSHPAVGDAVAAVGWRVLCMSDEGDAARFRQFRDFYALAAARHVATLAPGPPMAALDGAGYPRELPGGRG